MWKKISYLFVFFIILTFPISCNKPTKEKTYNIATNHTNKLTEKLDQKSTNFSLSEVTVELTDMKTEYNLSFNAHCYANEVIYLLVSWEIPMSDMIHSFEVFSYEIKTKTLEKIYSLESLENQRIQCFDLLTNGSYVSLVEEINGVSQIKLYEIKTEKWHTSKESFGFVNLSMTESYVVWYGVNEDNLNGICYIELSSMKYTEEFFEIIKDFSYSKIATNNDNILFQIEPKTLIIYNLKNKEKTSYFLSDETKIFNAFFDQDYIVWSDNNFEGNIFSINRKSQEMLLLTDFKKYSVFSISYIESNVLLNNHNSFLCIDLYSMEIKHLIKEKNDYFLGQTTLGKTYSAETPKENKNTINFFTKERSE